MKQDFKIGDRVFLFDSNRRQYTTVAPGGWGKLIYRAHFVENEIVGETRVSWLVGHKGWADSPRMLYKAPKRRTSTHPRFYTAEEVEEEVFADAHVHRIADKVRGVRGPALLEIARLAGYEVKP